MYKEVIPFLLCHIPILHVTVSRLFYVMSQVVVVQLVLIPNLLARHRGDEITLVPQIVPGDARGQTFPYQDHRPGLFIVPIYLNRHYSVPLPAVSSSV